MFALFYWALSPFSKKGAEAPVVGQRPGIVNINCPDCSIVSVNCLQIPRQFMALSLGSTVSLSAAKTIINRIIIM